MAGAELRAGIARRVPDDVKAQPPPPLRHPLDAGDRAQVPHARLLPLALEHQHRVARRRLGDGEGPRRHEAPAALAHLERDQLVPDHLGALGGGGGVGGGALPARLGDGFDERVVRADERPTEPARRARRHQRARAVLVQLAQAPLQEGRRLLERTERPRLARRREARAGLGEAHCAAPASPGELLRKTQIRCQNAPQTWAPRDTVSPSRKPANPLPAPPGRAPRASDPTASPAPRHPQP